jgi:hypothetical protein
MNIVLSLEATVGSSVLGGVTNTAHCKTLAGTLTVSSAQPKQQVGLHGAFETDCTEKNIWNSQQDRETFRKCTSCLVLLQHYTNEEEIIGSWRAWEEIKRHSVLRLNSIIRRNHLADIRCNIKTDLPEWLILHVERLNWLKTGYRDGPV